MTIIQSLWIGNTLSNIEIYSLKSFINTGHTVHLYIYNEIDNIPDGVVVKDGNDILPQNLIFKIKESVAPFADVFRYKLLYEKGNYWSDLDMICTRHFDFGDEYIFSSERTIQRGAYKSKKDYVANIGVLKAPLHSEFYNELYTKCLNNVLDNKERHYTHYMTLMRKQIEKYGFEKYVKPPETFCGLNWWHSKDMFYNKPFKAKYGVEPQGDLFENYSIHLWRHLVVDKYKMNVDDNYNSNSLWEKIKRYTDIDYVIAIPSYKRAETLKKKTLRVLGEYDIPKNKINIFVANDEEYEIYKKTLPDGYNIIIGELGMGNIRNFISNYFDSGKYIFNIDDDISKFIKLDTDKYEGKATAIPFTGDGLDKFIKDGFRECLRKKLNLFGIYPVDNPFFMSRRISYDLRYIIGSAWGCVNGDIRVSMDDKEDFERTIKYYIQDGGVIRYCNVSVVSSYYREKGGMQETRTNERILQSAQRLVKIYPKLCSLYLGKKNGFAEVKLNDKSSVKN
jgi:hypothetical protein